MLYIADVMLVIMYNFRFNYLAGQREPLPVYINVIRHPLDRLVSFYYFVRAQHGSVKQMSTEQRQMVCIIPAIDNILPI